MDVPKGSPILCLDFDGVLHSYSSGWKGARNIPDPPVRGAIEWLQSLIADQRNPFAPRHMEFDVQIFSSRSRYWGGRAAMKRWLLKHGMRPGEIAAITFPLFKPPAFLQIDDRAWTFTGTFPSVEQMQEFAPWNKPRKRHTVTIADLESLLNSEEDRPIHIKSDGSITA